MLVLGLSLVFSVLAQGGCGSVSKSDVCWNSKTEATCASPCWWWPDCGCYGASCSDPSHNTTQTCKGSVNGQDCGWNPEYSCGGSTDGCCEEASCYDYAHRSADTCPGTANGEKCVWNPDSNRCEYASCYDGEHLTQGTCKGTVDDRKCVWNSDSNRCEYASCSDGEHLTQGTCTGAFVDDTPCVWNGGANRCESAGCHDFQHNSEATCQGVVNGEACFWDGNYCEGRSCGYADDKNACGSLPLGCIWCTNGNWCGSGSCEICHRADGYEEMCKEGSAIYGCVWSDGKCNDSISIAFSIAAPVLVVALLLALLF